MLLQTDPMTNSATDISSVGLKLYQKETPALIPSWLFIGSFHVYGERAQAFLKTDSVTDSVTVI